MFPVSFAFLQNSYTVLYTVSNSCIFLLMYFAAFSILFSGHVLNNFTSSSIFLPPHMFPHVISSSCSEELPIRNINIRMPYLFFHLLYTGLQPFLALSPAKGVFPWPAGLWPTGGCSSNLTDTGSSRLLQAASPLAETWYSLKPWVKQQGQFSV